jgi:hypothetical protein
MILFQQPSFPAFSKALKHGISQLGGEVFIKLNWTAPVVWKVLYLYIFYLV